MADATFSKHFRPTQDRSTLFQPVGPRADNRFQICPEMEMQSLQLPPKSAIFIDMQRLARESKPVDYRLFSHKAQLHRGMHQAMMVNTIFCE
jgi:hypothetical protein